MVDLNAEIVPGVGAAGFRIGQMLSQIQLQLAESSSCAVRRWDESEGPLYLAIEETEGWFLHEGRVTSLSSNRGAVNLQFNTRGVLFNVNVYEGYRGCFANAVRIGDRLGKVLALTNLFFDSGDELYFPTEDSPIRGIGFYTGCCAEIPLEEAQEQTIIGISVHDWSLQ